MCFVFFFQAEDGIRDLVRSRGLGDVYKRQVRNACPAHRHIARSFFLPAGHVVRKKPDQAARALSLIHI